MAKRSDTRDVARERYLAKKQKGEKVNLVELAEEVGAKYDTVRRWKSQDKWDDQIKKKPGGQRGNKNAKGNKGGGAPLHNKNAEKDGAYSAIFLNQLTPEEIEIFNGAPREGMDALRHEMGILKVREKRILDKIREYEEMPPNELYLSKKTEMDGEKGSTEIYSKETPFVRIMQLQEALYKVQGRIASVAGSLRTAEESDRRIALERERLALTRMKFTGEVDDGGGDSE